MLQMMMLPDRERFLNIVDHSRGGVRLRLPDGTDCDRKADPRTRELLGLMELVAEGISISLKDPKYLILYLRDIMESVHDMHFME